MKKNEVLDYIPKTSINLVGNLINEDNLIIKVVNVRKTKHGDFRRLKDGSNQITIKNNFFYIFNIDLIFFITITTVILIKELL